jgi:hypothetical protein
MPCETVTVAEEDFVASAIDVAVTIAVEGDGTLAGAVYVVVKVVVPERMPQDGPLHPEPLKAHVTPWPLGSFATVALNCWVRFTETVRDAGETVTVIGGGVLIVTRSVTDFVLSLREVAVMLTVEGVGAVGGAV